MAAPAEPGGRRAHSRVAFVIPPTGDYCREDRCQSSFDPELVPTRRAPMEECEAAGAVGAAGAEAIVLDAPALGLGPTATLERVQAFEPDLLVIVATFGTLDADIGFAKLASERLPEAAIGLRGAPCYELSEQILRQAPEIDFCVRGEYELVFEEIVRLGVRHAQGVVLRDRDRIVETRRSALVSDLDALPMPDRSSLDPALYRVRWLNAPQATVRAQRGCPYPCSYCLVHSVSGSAARHRSPESVADEMSRICASGTRYFYVRAETFTLDRAWARAVSAEIAARCPEARWVTTTRADCVDDETVAAMRRGGCYGISFGIDAGSEAIGRAVGKRPDREKAKRAMRLCDRHGVVSLGYFMIGFLWDTPETLRETADFISDVRPDLLTIHYAHPYPGTRYYEQVREANATLHSKHAQAEPALALGDGTDGCAVSPAELRRAAAAISKRHYRRPSVLASIARKGARIGLDRIRPLRG